MSEHAIPNEWLALYYDGELNEIRRAQVQAHLRSCADCQRELAALKALSRVLVVDRLADDALASRAVFWRKLESRLPERVEAAPSLLKWLPGVGLLLANVLVQFVAVVSVVVMLLASQLGWIAQSIDWLDRALLSWLGGWLTWLLPAQWGGWGVSLGLVILSAWLAVLYLAWMGWMWLERRRPVMQSMSVLR